MIITNITLDQAYDLVDEELQLVGLADQVKSRDVIHITDRYLGEGYSSYTDQDAGLYAELVFMIKHYSK